MHQELGPQNKNSVISDLTALFCNGGLVVETLGYSGSVEVRSTIQLDGDLIVTIGRPALGQKSMIDSHIFGLETRLERTARFAKRAVWVVHGTIGLIVFFFWFHILSVKLTHEYPLTAVAIWFGLSVFSVAIIKWIQRTHFVRKLLLSSIMYTLTRFKTE